MSTDRRDNNGHDSDLASLVRHRRRELGLTRNDLVEASGLSYPYVAQIETGRRTPSRRSTARLAEALHLPPETLDAAIPYDEGTPRTSAPPPPTTTRGGWHANPSFVTAATASDAPDEHRHADPVEEVLRVLAVMTPTARLSVLVEAQRRVLDDLA